MIIQKKFDNTSVTYGSCIYTKYNMRRDCMKCEYCWHSDGIPDGCGYKLDGSMPIPERCPKDGKLVKKVHTDLP